VSKYLVAPRGPIPDAGNDRKSPICSRGRCTHLFVQCGKIVAGKTGNPPSFEPGKEVIFQDFSVVRKVIGLRFARM
jgi:hypothetical protein